MKNIHGILVKILGNLELLDLERNPHFMYNLGDDSFYIRICTNDYGALVYPKENIIIVDDSNLETYLEYLI